MSTTIDVICYKSKPLKNNEYPLMLRLTRDRKRKYKSLGVSTQLENWDFQKNQPKPNTPNRDLILEISANIIGKYRKTILELKSQGRDYTLNSLVDLIDKPQVNYTVHSFITATIEELQKQNRSKYAKSIGFTLTSMLNFNKTLDIYFSDIDVAWLKNFENWLRGEGLKINSIGIKMRSLRMLYNLAIEKEIVKAEHYPFNKYKVAKLSENTTKRALSKDDILNILNYTPNNRSHYGALAIDIFKYSYLMGGINFVDIAYLTNENIIDGVLVYKRKKTSKLIKLPLHEQAIELHTKYSNIESKYIFPILSSFHRTELQKENRIHKVIGNVNRELKAIGEELNLPIRLTTYVARHSFATVLKRSGVNTAIISESLGHSSEKITQIYLDSFENSQIDDAMKNLL